jgi:hypothetical protein
METPIKSFTELKLGDLVLIESPMSKVTLGDHEDDLCVVTSIIPTHKYPISDVGSTRKYYIKDRKPVYADECGDTGNEMIKEWGISSSVGGEYTFREDDEAIWNIRLIDKEHPRWDSKLSRNGKASGKMLNMLGKLFK